MLPPSLSAQSNTIVTQAGFSVQITDDTLANEVVKSLVGNLECNVCWRSFQRGFIHRPTSRGRTVDSAFPEGHVICKACAGSGYHTQKDHCLICNRKITAINYTGYDPIVKEPVDRLVVHCPSKTCNFLTQLVSIDAHIKQEHAKERLSRYDELELELELEPLPDPDPDPDPDLLTLLDRLINRLNVNPVGSIIFTSIMVTVLFLMFTSFIMRNITLPSSDFIFVDYPVSSTPNKDCIAISQELNTDMSLDTCPVDSLLIYELQKIFKLALRNFFPGSVDTILEVFDRILMMSDQQ